MNTETIPGQLETKWNPGLDPVPGGSTELMLLPADNDPSH